MRMYARWPRTVLSFPGLDSISESFFCILCRCPAFAITIHVPVAAATWVINGVLLCKQRIEIRRCTICRLFLTLELKIPWRLCFACSRCGSFAIKRL